MADDSSVLVSLSLTTGSGEGEVCDGGRDLYPTATLYMSPKCGSSKRQSVPKAWRDWIQLSSSPRAKLHWTMSMTLFAVLHSSWGKLNANSAHIRFSCYADC